LIGEETTESNKPKPRKVTEMPEDSEMKLG